MRLPLFVFIAENSCQREGRWIVYVFYMDMLKINENNCPPNR